MNDQINKILSDLYGIDPEFKKYEDRLINMISELLSSRPEAEIDDEFVKELRLKVMAEAEAMARPQQPEKAFAFNFMNMNKFAYAAGALAVLILLIIPALLLSRYKADQPLQITLNSGIKELAGNAFGEISADNIALNAADGRGSALKAESSVSQAPAGLGGGGGLAAEGMAKDMMIMPEMINYNYVYKGGDFSLESEKMKVYRRSELGGGQEFAAILSQVGFDLMDLSRFQDAKVTSINLNEEREFGYSVFLNFFDNSLSLYKNWNKWPQDDQPVLYSGTAEASPRNEKQWGIGDIPADNEIIAIADKFLRDYGINMANYASGEVQDNWRREYERAENKEMFYIPQEITVIYPLIIEGKTVYDQGGNKTGLYVGVDARHKKAASASSIKAHSFESSLYSVISDKEKIIQTAENGGSNNYLFKSDDPSRTVDIELGTPELKLVNYWRHNMEKGTGEELFIPSYIFPVASRPDDAPYFYSENVVVPLVSGLIETPNYGIMESRPAIVNDEAGADGADAAVEPIGGVIIEEQSQAESLR
jgi:hypothetical protein